MKSLFLILLITLVLYSCSPARISDVIVVEQINILDGQTHKYEVKLKTMNGSEVYYYTDFRFQVSDTLVSYFEYFEGKNSEAKKLHKEIDSLTKELNLSNYYLQILKERAISYISKTK